MMSRADHQAGPNAWPSSNGHAAHAIDRSECTRGDVVSLNYTGEQRWSGMVFLDQNP